MNPLIKGLAKKSFDFVIAGGGSAGCVIASRLSENPNTKVALLEAGPDDTSPLINVPLLALLQVQRKGKLNWYIENQGLEKYTKQPQDKQWYQPRGKSLGGTSSMNFMTYCRGASRDYNEWESLGNRNWGYKECLNYFKKSEHNETFKDDYHGQGGLLNVVSSTYRSQIESRLIESFQESGSPYNLDFNGRDQLGVGSYQMTQKLGRRQSSSSAFLRPFRGSRSNLSIFTCHHATQVVLDNKKAVGIVAKNTESGESIFFNSEKETILSLGSFGSPQLLLLSGIGSKEKLNPHSIPCLHELPGVGENLQDHVMVYNQFKSKIRSTEPSHIIPGIMEYRRKGTGMFTFNCSGGFIKAGQTTEPNVQIFFMPMIVSDNCKKITLGDGGTAIATLLRPESRGSVFLKSGDPFNTPALQFNYLKERNDVKTLIEGVRQINHNIQKGKFRDYLEKSLVLPADASDAEIEDFVLKTADTGCHSVGSCKMGNDSMAVVDDRLKLNGLEGLRVADASIMPTIVSGNTNAASIMIGERCSDFIKEQFKI